MLETVIVAVNIKLFLSFLLANKVFNQIALFSSANIVVLSILAPKFQDYHLTGQILVSAAKASPADGINNSQWTTEKPLR